MGWLQVAPTVLAEMEKAETSDKVGMKKEDWVVGAAQATLPTEWVSDSAMEVALRNLVRSVVAVENMAAIRRGVDD